MKSPIIAIEHSLLPVLASSRGKPAPTGKDAEPVGAGLPAKRPAQQKHNPNNDKGHPKVAFVR
ncbi:MAG: hypothetical protein ACN6QE_25810, partial [Pseudomonas putida]